MHMLRLIERNWQSWNDCFLHIDDQDADHGINIVLIPGVYL